MKKHVITPVCEKKLFVDISGEILQNKEIRAGLNFIAIDLKFLHFVDNYVTYISD